jgi:hypothetical protein
MVEILRKLEEDDAARDDWSGGSESEDQDDLARRLEGVDIGEQ